MKRSTIDWLDIEKEEENHKKGYLSDIIYTSKRGISSVELMEMIGARLLKQIHK
jgi:hypothetical protein